MGDTDRAQVALGAHRCSNPACPRLAEETIAALREELARVTAERDAVIATSQRALADVVATGERERDRVAAERDALRAVVAALPRCEGCGATATWRDPGDDTLWWCDDHHYDTDEELPYATALRELGGV